MPTFFFSFIVINGVVVAVVVVVAGTMTLFGVYSTLVSSLLTRVPPPRVAHLLFFLALPPLSQFVCYPSANLQ